MRFHIIKAKTWSHLDICSFRARRALSGHVNKGFSDGFDGNPHSVIKLTPGPSPPTRTCPG